LTIQMKVSRIIKAKLKLLDLVIGASLKGLILVIKVKLKRRDAPTIKADPKLHALITRVDPMIQALLQTQAVHIHHPSQVYTPQVNHPAESSHDSNQSVVYSPRALTEQYAVFTNLQTGLRIKSRF
jgi:hypothetical protein